MSKLHHLINNLSQASKNYPVIEFHKSSSLEVEQVSSKIPLSSELIEFYRLSSPKNFVVPGWVEQLEIYDLNDLLGSQFGYRWNDHEGDSVLPGWDPNWIVIGDCSSDPIIANISDPQTPVYVSLHGLGYWEPKMIAPSFVSFLELLIMWLRMIPEFHENIMDEEGDLKSDFLAVLSSRIRQIAPSKCTDNFIEFVTH